MFNNNLMVSSRLSKSQISNGCSTRVLKEISTLEERKVEIRHRVEQIQSRSRLINIIKQQIEVNRHITTTIQLDLNTVGYNIQKLNQRLRVANEEKLQLVIHLQHMQYRLQSIGKQLIQFFKHQPRQLDSIRLKMIQIEVSYDLKRLQSVFSLREAIVTFLKGQSQYEEEKYLKYGAELQISVKGLAQQFKWFLFNRLDEDNIKEFKQILSQPISKYVGLLKEAQSLIQLIKAASEDQQSKQLEYQQIQQKMIAEKSEVLKLQLRIAEQSKIINQVENKIQLFQQIIISRQKDKKEATLTITKLNNRIIQISQQPIETNNLLFQLGEINQAIDYLSSKRFCNENVNDLNIRSYKQIQWQNEPSTSPSRITSADLMIKSKAREVKNTTKLIYLKSPVKTKNNISLTSINKIGSPFWK